MEAREAENTIYISLLKPLFDFLIAFSLFIISSPILLFISVIQLIANKGQVFFIQTRIGKNEKPFQIYKFQTLRNVKDSTGKFLPDSERQTTLGNSLRKLHLDELPQLINVIKGDMALIGPRPLHPEYLSYYTDYQKSRHTVKPGITGLTQVFGGNGLPWNQRLRLDSFYALKLNSRLDILILLRTIAYFFHKKTSAPHLSESFIKNK